MTATNSQPSSAAASSRPTTPPPSATLRAPSWPLSSAPPRTVHLLTALVGQADAQPDTAAAA